MKKLISILSAVAVSSTLLAAPWAPAGDHILTRWASEVDPMNTLPEYPRPQMVRQDWMNLNGLWDYAIAGKDATAFKAEGQILVPFAVESSLSGVGRTVGAEKALWYERTFNLPSKWKGRDVMLHFGAVDWQAEVWINGVRAGEHRGGYTPFSFDITSLLKKSGPQKITVRVYDQDDLSWQPRGKQVSNPMNMWHTSVTGIWQTVWLEPVSKTRIEGWDVSTDIDKAEIRLAVDCHGTAAGDVVKAELIEGGIGYSAQKPGDKVIAEAVAEGGTACISVPDMKCWSPDSPYLYGLRISVVRKGKVLDKVESYTSMRKISRMDQTMDGKAYHRMALNNEPLFQFGLLDQGWWPDGLYTAPTDEALRFDVEKTRECGYNMIRKHIKVEPARWYYWCDVLGILVWQDMPNIADHSLYRHQGGLGMRSEDLARRSRNVWMTDAPREGTDCDVPQEWKDNYYREWAEIINSVKNFQCVVMWVPFNEAWGQFDTGEVVRFTRELDPSRLVNEASGGNYRGCGDIMDTHHYPVPCMHDYDKDVINVLGEYGAIALVCLGHTWKEDGNRDNNGLKRNFAEVLGTYADYAEMLKVFIRTGCSAAVYAQTTDVESEVNGIMTYDREIVKMDIPSLNRINTSVIGSMK